MENLELIRECILKGDGSGAVKYTTVELNRGTPWRDVLNALFSAMHEVGEEFSNGTAFLPELLASGDAGSKAMQVIKESIGDFQMEPVGTIVMGTIFGDLHDIGKNVVIVNFETTGFKVVDLGVDVQPEQFIVACKENKANLVGISALLSSTMLNMEKAIERIRGEKLDVKIMVGGNPVTAEFAGKIGADGYAPDGFEAVKEAKKLLGIS